MARTEHVTAKVTPALKEDLRRDAEALGISLALHLSNLLEAATSMEAVHPSEIKSN